MNGSRGGWPSSSEGGKWPESDRVVPWTPMVRKGFKFDFRGRFDDALPAALLLERMPAFEQGSWRGSAWGRAQRRLTRTVQKDLLGFPASDLLPSCPFIPGRLAMHSLYLPDPSF
mmetsp:Transcript_16351/g.23802  ORF Transcript_16351/g.23802 Transcript_16351/m.23802 type:complete len:115 (-) Transcript_16351:198-542(-)